jgi:chaperonin GroES
MRKIMKIKPIHANVVVKAMSKEEVTKSGIVLPDTVDKERPERGEVIAVGEGKLLDNGSRAPMSVKVGDKVIFKKYSPDEIKIDDVEYLVLSESDIIAILE